MSARASKATRDFEEFVTGVSCRALALYSKMPSDWLAWAVKLLVAQPEGGREKMRAVLASRLGPHIVAQAAYGLMHRDTMEGLVAAGDALGMASGCLRRGRKRVVMVERHSKRIAAYYAPVPVPDSPRAYQRWLKTRIFDSWSGAKLPSMGAKVHEAAQ